MILRKQKRTVTITARLLIHLILVEDQLVLTPLQPQILAPMYYVIKPLATVAMVVHGGLTLIFLMTEAARIIHIMIVGVAGLPTPVLLFEPE